MTVTTIMTNHSQLNLRRDSPTPMTITERLLCIGLMLRASEQRFTHNCGAQDGNHVRVVMALAPTSLEQPHPEK